jgi:hypothetical protein
MVFGVGMILGYGVLDGAGIAGPMVTHTDGVGIAGAGDTLTDTVGILDGMSDGVGTQALHGAGLDMVGVLDIIIGAGTIITIVIQTDMPIIRVDEAHLYIIET